MYAQAGEDSAIMDKLRAKLGTRIDGFTKLMREEIAERCKSRCIATETIAFHPQPGILNPALRAANYPGTRRSSSLNRRRAYSTAGTRAHRSGCICLCGDFRGSDVAWRSSIASRCALAQHADHSAAEQALFGSKSLCLTRQQTRSPTTSWYWRSLSAWHLGSCFLVQLLEIE